jgi:hypothetical protein
MWNLHTMGKAYGRLPSRILGIDDPWAAYQLDHACVIFGTWVESKLGERDKKGRPKHQLSALLCAPGAAHRPATSARPARAMVRRKVKIGEDGTW